MWCRLNRVKTISLILVGLMLWHFAGLRVYAQSRSVQRQQETERTLRAPLKAPLENRFDGLLGELRDVIKQGAEKTKAAPVKGFAAIEKLTELKEKLIAENEKNQNYFSQVEERMKALGPSVEVLNRHKELVSKYETRYQTLLDDLAGIESAHKETTGLWGRITGQNQRVDWNSVINKTVDFLEANTTRPTRHNFDPRNLPHRSLKADNPVSPKLTREEWDRALSTDLAHSRESKAGAKNTAQNTSASGSGDEAGHSDRLLQPRGTAPPTDADLAETIEVKFTPEIRALAISLNKNPVKIYNWVRNNIEFVPTWGSIQGAQLCLETRACNAFDTSSLLIALLRASGIPSRYQLGTVEIPIDKFMNWAGGFTNADAAASLFASAGIPSVVRRVDQAGRVVSVKLEQVWVKAFVDYAPSGGAVHLRGNTWIEMDPSFKQYVITQGVDFEAATPSNFQSLAIQLAQAANINPVTGSVTGIDSAALQSFAQQQADQRINYLRTNSPNITVRETIGGRSISAFSPALLPAVISNRVLARANEITQIPDSLRHQVTFRLGSNPQIPDSADLFSYTTSLPEIAGKNILLLYRPASAADEQLLLQSQSTFSSSIRALPQLYVGSQLVATGQPLPMGSPVVSQIAFLAPTISTPAVFNTMQAGETAAIGVDLQGVSHAQLTDLKDKTQGIGDKVQQGTFQSLTSRDYSEAFLSTNIMSWFAMVDGNNQLTSRNAGVVSIRYPSSGIFSVKQRATSLFGAVISVALEGLSMDIDRDIIVSGATNGDASKAASLSISQGMFGSVNEADVPVRLLSTPDHPASGMATMQALQKANDQGIPIYRINASNAATIVPLLEIDSSDLADIQDAVNSGLEITVSKRPISFNGSSVLGIIISDVLSGSASFLISGGSNGALVAIGFLLMIVLLCFAAVLFPPLIPILSVIVAGLVLGLIIFLAIIYFGGHNLNDPLDQAIFNLTPCILAAISLGVLGGGLAILFALPTFMDAFALSLGITLAVARQIVALLRTAFLLAAAAVAASRC